MTTYYKTFQKLMSHRITSILIISSPYDAFIMEEDGGMLEHVFANYRGVSLTRPPTFTVVPTAREALSTLKKEKFDLVIIIIPKFLGMDPVLLGREIKSIEPQLPVVLLAHGMKGLTQYMQGELPRDSIDNVFVWSGNRHIMWTIVKWLEDRMNAAHDTQFAKVRVLILIEDSPYYYSSLLPILYKAIVQQTQAVLGESLNEEHRLWKLRARTKILLARNYEEGMQLYHRFKPFLLGVFSDTRFPREGVIDEEAGLHFISHVKNEMPTLPMLLLSTDSINREKANAIESHFQDKNSPSLHLDIRRFMIENMGFGDFVFRLPNGIEVARAQNFLALEKALSHIPDESLHYHVSRNHFSNWLMARSEIALASKFGPLTPQDFDNDMTTMRKFLIDSLREKRIAEQRGVITLFNSTDFDIECDFMRVGDGSLGGKARGLAFMSKFLTENQNLFKDLPNVEVSLPRTLVLTTDCYDQFIEENNLQEYARIQCRDEEVAAKFAVARMPGSLENTLRVFLERTKKVPLAIRSSSLLEDSRDWPYAGLYSTYMVPNDQQSFNERLRHLMLAIRLVYASVFFESPKAFSRTTQHRTEEEKMAVVIQAITGERHGEYFYPTISGVAQSHNFYPLAPMTSEDGIAHISMGLGKIVVEGGQAIRFCPKYPQILPQFASVDETLKNAQQFFYAIRLNSTPGLLGASENDDVERRSVHDHIKDEALKAISSSYYPLEHRIRDICPGKGTMPVVTCANILKYNHIPLAELITRVLDMAKKGFGSDIEIEFAINFTSGENPKTQFTLLQTRPLTTTHENFAVEITNDEMSKALCFSTSALGKNLTTEIRDVIIVKPEMFNGRTSLQIAEEISKVNAELIHENRKFLLIGTGRWGSSDKNLGVPVAWKDISQVGGIIEAATENFKVDPSQGTHFFQNITSQGIIYLTIRKAEDLLRWDWFLNQEVVSETEHIKHVWLKHPLNIKVDGKKNHGIVLAEGFGVEKSSEQEEIYLPLYDDI